MEECKSLRDSNIPVPGCPLHSSCIACAQSRGVIWAASIGVYHCRDMAGACSCNCTSECVCWSLPVEVGLGKGGEDMEPCKHAVTYVVMIKLSDKGR